MSTGRKSSFSLGAAFLLTSLLAASAHAVGEKCEDSVRDKGFSGSGAGEDARSLPTAEEIHRELKKDQAESASSAAQPPRDDSALLEQSIVEPLQERTAQVKELAESLALVQSDIDVMGGEQDAVLDTDLAKRVRYHWARLHPLFKTRQFPVVLAMAITRATPAYYNSGRLAAAVRNYRNLTSPRMKEKFLQLIVEDLDFFIPRATQMDMETEAAEFGLTVEEFIALL